MDDAYFIKVLCKYVLVFFLFVIVELKTFWYVF